MIHQTICIEFDHLKSDLLKNGNDQKSDRIHNFSLLLKKKLLTLLEDCNKSQASANNFKKKV